MVAVADPLEQRVLRLESDVLILNRSLQGNSRLGGALRPTDVEEWSLSQKTLSPSLFSLPSTALSSKTGSPGSLEQSISGHSRIYEKLDEERQRRDELRQELKGSISEIGDRVEDVHTKLNKAVQRLSAAQAALQEHCAELAVQTEAALQEHGSSLMGIRTDKESTPSPLEQLRRSLEAADARLESRCANLESVISAFNTTEILDERFAEIKAMVRKHCASMQAQLNVAEPLAELLASPRKGRPSEEMASPRKESVSPRKELLSSPRKAGLARNRTSLSVTSLETVSTIVEDEREMASTREEEEDESEQAQGAGELCDQVRSLGLAELFDRLAEVQTDSESRCQRLEAKLDELKPSNERLVDRMVAVETSMKDSVGKLGSRVDSLAARESAEVVSDRLTLRLAAVEASCERRWVSLEAKFESQLSGLEANLEGRCCTLEAACDGRWSSLDAKFESQVSGLEASMEGRCGLLEAKVGARSVSEAVTSAFDKLNARITAVQALTEQRCSQVETQVCARQRSCTSSTTAGSR